MIIALILMLLGVRYAVKRVLKRAENKNSPKEKHRFALEDSGEQLRLCGLLTSSHSYASMIFHELR